MYVYSHTNTKRTAKGTLNDHGMYLDPNFSSCQRSNGTHELTRRFLIRCAAKERLGTKLRSRCKMKHAIKTITHLQQMSRQTFVREGSGMRPFTHTA
jgi:hypothetical protein